MKRLFAIAAVMLLSSAMFFVASGAGADTVEVPTHGTWTGTGYFLGPCPDTNFPPGAIQVLNVGQGTLTQAGKSHFVSMYCSYFTSPTTMAGSGWMIVTASNGDKLHLSIEITDDFSFMPPRWSEHEVIEGGTGKFDGATGESDSAGTLTLLTDPFPYGTTILPGFLMEPASWIGTTDGWIMY